MWKIVGLRLSSEVGSLSLRMGDPCTIGGQFSSVEDILLGSFGRSEAEGNSPRTITSGEAVLGGTHGLASCLYLSHSFAVFLCASLLFPIQNILFHF